MIPLGQIDETTTRVFARVMSSPEAAETIDQWLKKRKELLNAQLNRAARAALLDSKAQAPALIIQGQLWEIEQLVEVVDRFLITGTTAMPTIKRTTPQT